MQNRDSQRMQLYYIFPLGRQSPLTNSQCSIFLIQKNMAILSTYNLIVIFKWIMSLYTPIQTVINAIVCGWSERAKACIYHLLLACPVSSGGNSVTSLRTMIYYVPSTILSALPNTTLNLHNTLRWALLFSLDKWWVWGTERLSILST